MRYISINWLHDLPEEPVFILIEADASDMEVRKIEVYNDGSSGHADAQHQEGGTQFGFLAVPSLNEIIEDAQFKGVEISKEVFERAWRLAIAHEPISDHDVGF